MGRIGFGWRMPTFPVDEARGSLFIDQVTASIREFDGVYDSIWVDDHLHPWATFMDNTTDVLECWTTLSYIAGITRHASFGPFVLCQSYRNPALLAKMAATLQVLSKGRFIMAIGAGWKEDEYKAYGYEFPKISTRMKQLEESLEIIRRMWREEASTFHGRWYHIEKAYCYPKPDPPPPIMIGVGGRMGLKIAAKYADWWNWTEMKGYKDKLDLLRQHCRSIGRDPREIKPTLGIFVAIGESGEEAGKIAERSPFTTYFPPYKRLIGDPNEIAEGFREQIEIGVEHFIIRFMDFPDKKGAKLFAQKVIPKLR